MEQPNELISQAEFARRLAWARGVEYTRATVSNWVKEGRIPSQDGKIPYPDALEAFDKYVAPKPEGGAKTIRDPGVDPETEAQPTLDMATAKLKHQALQTARAQLDFDRARGALLEREAVLSECFAMFRLVADQVRALGGKHAARLATMTDRVAIRKLLDGEADTMLDVLYRRIAELPETVKEGDSEGAETGG